MERNQLIKMEKVNVYILKLKDGRYYCGITNNLVRRFKEHTEKVQSWASKVGVIKIEYTREFDTRKQAAIMEKKIKVFGVGKFIKYFRVHKKSKF